jgi:peptidoglycan/LPS O-acetylase OafA/YrhL
MAGRSGLSKLRVAVQGLSQFSRGCVVLGRGWPVLKCVQQALRLPHSELVPHHELILILGLFAQGLDVVLQLFDQLRRVQELSPNFHFWPLENKNQVYTFLYLIYILTPRKFSPERFFVTILSPIPLFSRAVIFWVELNARG